jgi:nucleoside-diphosphate-sugar epimerase
MKSRRVLVTGGTGFIGRHLVARLVDLGADVTVAVAPGESIDGLKTVPIDLRDRASLSVLAGTAPHVVFHLAGFSLVGESWKRIAECFDLNAKGTALVLDATRSAEAFVYASTAEIYGPQERMPLDESMRPAPVSPYAISKHAGELSCAARARDGATRVSVLRLFNVYGPGQRPPALVADLAKSCAEGLPIRTTKGEQTRDFVYVGDVVDAMVAAATRAEPLDGPVNVCSGRETAIRDLVTAVARVSETASAVEIGALPYRANETWRVFGDNTRARRLLGWEPRVGIEEGLARTVGRRAP